MPITLTVARAATHPNRIVPVFADGPAHFPGVPVQVRKAAQALAAVRDFTGQPEQLLLLPQGGEQWLFCGMGAAAALTRPRFAEGVGRALGTLAKSGGARCALLLPAELPWSVAEAARYATEALHMAAYTFAAYRTRKTGAREAEVELVAPGAQTEAAQGMEIGSAVGRAIAMTRDLINQPAAVAHTDFMVETAREVAEGAGASFQAIRGEELAAAGYGAIHAVGQAAQHPPALVALAHGRPGRNRPTLALVGKGVVFDTGGLDIKSSSGMALMKKDMGGAAIVLGAFQAIVALKLPLRLVAVLGLAENAVGPQAYHPGDILRSKAGLTVEITNTDAEGRLVLADAFALAHTFEPDYMVDFATLTGACRTALGRDLMGLFCDHAPLREALQAAAEATGEALWPLPLWAPYRKKLDSHVADLANAATDSLGGAITAALFLQEFAGEIAWAHLDCYAWSDGDHPLYPKGGSGIGVRLMADVAVRLSRTPGKNHPNPKEAAHGLQRRIPQRPPALERGATQGQAGG